MEQNNINSRLLKTYFKLNDFATIGFGVTGLLYLLILDKFDVRSNYLEWFVLLSLVIILMVYLFMCGIFK